MRPGRADMTTMRVDRNTASWIECVTKTTVRRSRDHNWSNCSLSRSRVISSSAPNGSSVIQELRLKAERGQWRHAAACRRKAAKETFSRIPATRPAPVAFWRSPPRSAAAIPLISRGARHCRARCARDTKQAPGTRSRTRRPAERASPGDMPFTDTVPAVAGSRSEITRNSVVLPHPEGPISETNSPSMISRLTEDSAVTGASSAE